MDALAALDALEANDKSPRKTKSPADKLASNTAKNTAAPRERPRSGGKTVPRLP
jgi:hypothetical protein